MRVFLTGGTGYLGASIARALIEAGHQVTALARDAERAASLVGCGAQLVVGDVADSAAFEDELAGCEGLVHTAGFVRSWHPEHERFDRINVTGALDLLDRARRAGIERTLVTSSFFALGPSDDGPPLDESAANRPLHPVSRANDYVRTKSVMTRRVIDRQKKGAGVMLAIPTILLGPGPRTRGNHTARVLAGIGKRRFPGLVGHGDQVWNLVGVEDAARGHVLALERGTPGENYIFGGEDWTQRRFVERAAAAFGVPPVTRRLGTALPAFVGRTAETWAALTGREPLLTRGEVRLYDRNWSFSSAKARRDLGYEPEPVQRVLESTVTWLKEEIWKRR